MAFLLPMRVIKQMWLLGGWFDADKAMQLDYVQRVVPIDKLDNELARWAESAAGLNTEQIAVYKEGIHRMYEIAGLLGIIGFGNKVSGHVSGVDKERLEKDARFPFGLPNLDNANYLWIQLFYSSLNKAGRAGFVMANSAGDARRSGQKTWLLVCLVRRDKPARRRE